MLKHLSIRNYALVEELDADFSSGLVIVTGETGSGKSIIIDALGLILGDRAGTEVIRKGADRAVIEATFHTAGNKKLAQLLTEEGLEAAEELIVRRELSAKGQSRCFAADSPVTLGVQKRIGELLVDLHGQHQHQSLLRVETHVAMLDDFGGLDGMVEDFQAARDRLLALERELGELRQRERQLAEKKEFYEFQMAEIDAVSPLAGEEEELAAELSILENAEKLFASTGSIYAMIYDGDQSIRDQLVVVRNTLQDLAGIDPSFVEAAKECGSAEAIVTELAKFIQAYNARVEFNPERLELLRDRLGRLALLKKKYGGSVDAVLAHREAIGREVLLAANFDEVISGLESEREKARNACAEKAMRLSSKRHDIGRKIDGAVVAELQKLGIRHAKFSTRMEQRELREDETGPYIAVGKRRIRLGPRGCDDVEFYLSTNLGEEAKPLVQVASGGEVSRIMLALKTILAKSDRLPVLIFDEIDVGISGRIAQAVGQSLKSLSAFHQVIAITHLPQIAGLAETHHLVSKEEQKGRTTSSMRRLSLEEQVREVAKLMSGAEVTDAGLKGARELMGLGATG